MLRSLFVSIILLIWSTTLQAQIKSEKRPQWVEKQAFAKSNAKWQQSGYQWLLYDRQVNLKEEENYYHYALLLETPAAVSELSNLELSYDPAYEELVMHSITLHRKDEKISVLEQQIPQVIRRESSRDRLLYDSSFAVIFNIEDVRPGDVLEYSFTRKGVNPLFKDHQFALEYFKNSAPIGKMFLRILAPTKEQPQLFLRNKAPAPKVMGLGVKTEYRWSLDDLPVHKFYNDEPSWFDDRPSVVISNYKNWNELVNKLLPWYSIPYQESVRLKEEAILLTKDAVNIQEKITRLCRFVQDEIRYLGFENGINAYKPHSSVTVFDNRYGDCKDKSLLLVGLLKGIDVEASPLLVNSSLRKSVPDESVSPYFFNHCVVMAKYEEDTIYIDPTLSELGGLSYESSFPTYGKGLLLKAGSNSLLNINHKNEGKIEVSETFIVSSPEEFQATKLQIITLYTGIEADNMRSYFRGNSAELITENYENYYKAVYPGIKSIAKVEVRDDRRFNKIQVFEEYSIDSLWVLEDGKWEATFRNPEFNGILSYQADKDRSAPLYLPFPRNYIFNRSLNLPRSMEINSNKDEIRGEEYKYTYNEQAVNNNRLVLIRQVYKTFRAEVAAADYERFVKDHDKMLAQSSYGLSVPVTGGDALASTNALLRSVSNSDGSSSANWTLMAFKVLNILALLAMLLLFHKIIKSYINRQKLIVPEWVKETRPAIGGWLVVLIILTIIGFIGNLIFFFASLADVLETQTYQNPYVFFLELLGLFLLQSLLLFLVVLSLQAIIHFFKRHLVTPKLFKVYFISLIIIDLLLILITLVGEPSDFYDFFPTLMGQIIFAVIWIFYFSKSIRVAETFVKGQLVEDEQIEIKENVSTNDPLSNLLAATNKGLAEDEGSPEKN